MLRKSRCFAIDFLRVETLVGVMGQLRTGDGSGQDGWPVRAFLSIVRARVYERTHVCMFIGEYGQASD